MNISYVPGDSGGAIVSQSLDLCVCRVEMRFLLGAGDLDEMTYTHISTNTQTNKYTYANTHTDTQRYIIYPYKHKHTCTQIYTHVCREIHRHIHI